MISWICLGIGLFMLLITIIVAIRFRVISNFVSELTEKKGSSDPLTASSSATAGMSVRTGEGSVGADASQEEKDEDIITTVVGSKPRENISDTVVVGGKNGGSDDFRIIRSILLINADVDVIDEYRRNE
jgi:hypothetical protein